MQSITERIKEHLRAHFSLPEEQVEMLLPSFLETLSTHMANLESAMDEGDPATYGKFGHTIKGAFLNLGLTECAEIAMQIEKKGKAGEATFDYIQLIDELRLKISPLLK